MFTAIFEQQLISPCDPNSIRWSFVTSPPLSLSRSTRYNLHSPTL